MSFRRQRNFNVGLLKAALRSLPILILAVFFLLASIYLADGLHKIFRQDMLVKFNMALVPLFCIVIVVRMFFDAYSLKNLQCYLTLPISRMRLAMAFLLKNSFALWTVLPFLFLMPFWYYVLFQVSLYTTSVSWLGKLLLLNWFAYLISMLGRLLLVYHFTYFIILFSAICMIVVWNYYSGRTFLFVLLSGRLFNEPEMDVIWLPAMTILAIALSVLVTWIISLKMTVDTLSH